MPLLNGLQALLRPPLHSHCSWAPLVALHLESWVPGDPSAPLLQPTVSSTESLTSQSQGLSGLGRFALSVLVPCPFLRDPQCQGPGAPHPPPGPLLQSCLPRAVGTVLETMRSPRTNQGVEEDWPAPTQHSPGGARAVIREPFQPQFCALRGRKVSEAEVGPRLSLGEAAQ